MERSLQRQRPLPIEVGDRHVLLPASDAEFLIGAIDAMVRGVERAPAGAGRGGRSSAAVYAHLNELMSLRERLASWSGSLLEPVRLDTSQSRLLRGVLSDVTGYQRGELTEPLRELRRVLSAH
jgi:hypothetical protein